MHREFLRKSLALFLCLAINFVWLNFWCLRNVNATAVTTFKDTVSTMKASVVASHTIQFTIPNNTVIAAGGTVILTFDSGYDFGSLTTGDVTVSTAGSVSWGSAPSGVSTVGKTITLTSAAGGTAGATETVTVTANGTNKITNGTAGNDKTITMSGTAGLTGSLATAWLSNDVVTVSATVNPTLTFSLSANAVNFGSLSASQVRYADTGTGQNAETAGHTMSIATNAATGYAITYNGATLTSGSYTIDVASAINAGGTTGTEQFALGFAAAGGAGTTGTVSAGYTHGAAGYTFIAGATTTFISGAGPSNTNVISAYYLANIATNTEAGTYTTSITYTATGNF